MELMFEDEAEDVGSDVEAYCPKCKGDTTHVVISKYEDEIRRVQCSPCGDVHSYRKPRGEAEDDIPEPVAARKRALLKKLTWEEFFAKYPDKDAKPYEFREAYRENHIVFHPKFGKGFVSEVVSDSKVEISFRDARRVLVHNRKDIPGLPLASEGDGTPTPKGKRARKGQPAAAPAKGPVKAVRPVAAAPVDAGSAARKAGSVAKPSGKPREQNGRASKPRAARATPRAAKKKAARKRKR